MPGKNFKLKIRNYKLTRAFTLIEILVTISIISVLIATVTINYINIQKKARDGRRKADVAQIQQLLERYYQEHGKYPDGDDPGHVSTAQSTNAQPWIAGLSEFTDALPVDPINVSGGKGGVRNYNYFVFGTDPLRMGRQHYLIMMNLENDDDPNRRAFDQNQDLVYSPCDESAYYQRVNTWIDYVDYDYCFSSPR